MVKSNLLCTSFPADPRLCVSGLRLTSNKLKPRWQQNKTDGKSHLLNDALTFFDDYDPWSGACACLPKPSHVLPQVKQNLQQLELCLHALLATVQCPVLAPELCLCQVEKSSQHTVQLTSINMQSSLTFVGGIDVVATYPLAVFYPEKARKLWWGVCVLQALGDTTFPSSKRLYIPDERAVLRLAASLAFNDAPW